MKLSARIRNFSRQVSFGISEGAKFLLAPISFRELLLFSGCALIWFGLDAIYPPASVIVPGVILAGVAIFGVR